MLFDSLNGSAWWFTIDLNWLFLPQWLRTMNLLFNTKPLKQSSESHRDDSQINSKKNMTFSEGISLHTAATMSNGNLKAAICRMIHSFDRRLACWKLSLFIYTSATDFFSWSPFTRASLIVDCFLLCLHFETFIQVSFVDKQRREKISHISQYFFWVIGWATVSSV